MATTKNEPWHEAYPRPATPLDEVPSISREEVLARTKSTPRNKRTFLLVDLRRADHTGGAIRDSINVPAQSMYHSIPMLYDIFSRAGIDEVVWFCGSSRGRGPRAAAWFSEYILSQHDKKMKSVTLQGGIKGWVAAGPEYTDLMDGFVAEPWMNEKIEQ